MIVSSDEGEMRKRRTDAGRGSYGGWIEPGCSWWWLVVSVLIDGLPRRNEVSVHRPMGVM